MTTPQCRSILRLLESSPEGITQQDAIAYVSCYRLAARISDLRAEGVLINSEIRHVRGRSFAVYTLVNGPVQTDMGLV